MHKLFLIAALVLASATAQAGATRGLILASNDASAAEQPKPAQATASPEVAAAAPKAEQPQRRSIEARVIRELHRHGIYW
jgi:hypothetical protein